MHQKITCAGFSDQYGLLSPIEESEQASDNDGYGRAMPMSISKAFEPSIIIF